LDDFVNWLRRNSRYLLYLTIVLVILSSLFGFFMGMLKKRSLIGGNRPYGEVEKNIVKESKHQKKEKNLLLPSPILPDFDEDFSEYEFYFNQNNSNQDNLKLIPITPSQLIKNKAINIDETIKPFEFDNERLDILTNKNELLDH